MEISTERISNEVMAKVFAGYLGCECDPKTRVNHFTYILDNVRTKGEYYDLRIKDTDVLSVNYAGWFKLILKPLSKISDEDAIEVVNIIIPYKSQPTKRIVRRRSHLVEISTMGGSKFEFYIQINSVSGEICQSTGAGKNSVSSLLQAYQFLQSRGYDLPNYYLNGRTLEQAGLAIYETKKV